MKLSLEVLSQKKLLSTILTYLRELLLHGIVKRIKKKKENFKNVGKTEMTKSEEKRMTTAVEVALLVLKPKVF